MYIQIPANAFYFVLGIICGVIALICILSILARKQAELDRQKYKQLFDTLSELEDDKNKNDK